MPLEKNKIPWLINSNRAIFLNTQDPISIEYSHSFLVRKANKDGNGEVILKERKRLTVEINAYNIQDIYQHLALVPINRILDSHCLNHIW